MGKWNWFAFIGTLAVAIEQIITGFSPVSIALLMFLSGTNFTVLLYDATHIHNNPKAEKEVKK